MKCNNCVSNKSIRKNNVLLCAHCGDEISLNQINIKYEGPSFQNLHIHTNAFMPSNNMSPNESSSDGIIGLLLLSLFLCVLCPPILIIPFVFVIVVFIFMIIKFIVMIVKFIITSITDFVLNCIDDINTEIKRTESHKMAIYKHMFKYISISLLLLVAATIIFPYLGLLIFPIIFAYLWENFCNLCESKPQIKTKHPIISRYF